MIDDKILFLIHARRECVFCKIPFDKEEWTKEWKRLGVEDREFYCSTKAWNYTVI